MESVSSVLGYYNILAHVIPGLLYLYILNEVCRIGDLPYLKLNLSASANLPAAILAVEIIAVVLAAFVISHLLEPIAARILFLAVGKKPRIDSLNRLKRIHPTIKIDFTFDEIDILHTVIQHRNPEVSRMIEQYQALSVMLRNLSVGFFLLGALQFTVLLLGGDWSRAIFGILAILLSIVAISRSITNRMWSYNIIYEAALEYGSNLEEVIENSSYRQKKSKPGRAKTNAAKSAQSSTKRKTAK
jgi:hypothetical protein